MADFYEKEKALEALRSAISSIRAAVRSIESLDGNEVVDEITYFDWEYAVFDLNDLGGDIEHAIDEIEEYWEEDEEESDEDTWNEEE